MLDADMFFAEECTPEKPCSWPLLCGACSARAARHCLRIAGFVEGSDPPALTRKGNVKIIFSYEVQQYVRGSVVLQLLTRGGEVFFSQKLFRRQKACGPHTMHLVVSRDIYNNTCRTKALVQFLDSRGHSAIFDCPS